MRRLLILRHAKAVPHGSMPDHDRILTGRGREDAAELGRYLAAEHLVPDLALVSTSARTRETWAEAAAALPAIPVQCEDAIYEATPDRLLDIVRAAGGDIATLAIVGHNPGFAELMRRLPGHGDRYALARIRTKVPTAALAVIDFPIDAWRDITIGTGRLDRFVTPKDPVG